MSASSPRRGPPRLQLKFGRLKNPVSTLSGRQPAEGRAGKWLARSPALLIIDEPTRGIDVGTKAEVHRLLDELVAQGVAVLMISSELPEVLGMADRVLVLREGRLVAEIARAEADEDSIMRAATGQRRGERPHDLDDHRTPGAAVGSAAPGRCCERASSASPSSSSSCSR